MSAHITTSIVAPLIRVWRRLDQLAKLRASRQQLAELDDALLKDIGISRAQALFEASRPAWDAGPAPAKPPIRIGQVRSSGV